MMIPTFLGLQKFDILLNLSPKSPNAPQPILIFLEVMGWPIKKKPSPLQYIYRERERERGRVREGERVRLKCELIFHGEHENNRERVMWHIQSEYSCII